MSTLLETVNTTRENTIATHYAAAAAELEEKIRAEPLKRVFIIHAGCVSDQVMEEIAHRFKIGGVKATPVKSGYITRAYIIAEPDLPTTLIHEEPKPESKPEVEETKSEGETKAETKAEAKVEAKAEAKAEATEGVKKE